MTRLLFIFLILGSQMHVTAQKLVRYDLEVTDTLVNYTGKTRKAIAINGLLPAPTLYFTEGDTAEIHVRNMMHHETSIHWHGLLLPNEQDGVPYLTTAPIKGMSTHTYRFPIRQSGTFWYHSHTMLQEQIGLYGAFIIYKKDEVKENQEVVLLSDWTDENPHQIERSLHFASDWYGIKKKATQNYFEALKQGYLKTRFTNEWKRMHAMDVSDVYYERFLLNGATEQEKKEYKPGEKIRLRVINGSASTYFWLNFSGGKITVVASDGIDVEPVEVDRLIIGVSEIYDVEVVIPEGNKSYEFTATSEDRTGSSSLWLGSGERIKNTPLPKLNYFEGMKMMNEMMTLGGKMKDMGMQMSLQQMDMNMVMYEEYKTKQGFENKSLLTLNYAMLRSPEKTTLPDKSYRTLNFELTGNMNRYVWTVNNKTISESDKILIKKGENIRIILVNNSMMRHPMHLHGHYFRVLNGQGEYAPLKNVLDIMPMETDTIEFNASEEYGDWYFHCHILYHMMAGMGRIFRYEDTPPNPQIPDSRYALRKVYNDDRRFYLGAEISVESNGTDGEISLMNTRWKLQTEWRIGLDDHSGYESESHLGRMLGANQFAMVYTGWDWRYKKAGHQEKTWFGAESSLDQRAVICFGLEYTLPWLLKSDLRIDHRGDLRVQISRDDIPVTSRLRLWGMYNSDNEYSTGMKYILSKYISLSAHYDSDMGSGAGMTFVY